MADVIEICEKTFNKKYVNLNEFDHGTMRHMDLRLSIIKRKK